MKYSRNVLNELDELSLIFKNTTKKGTLNTITTMF